MRHVLDRQREAPCVSRAPAPSLRTPHYTVRSLVLSNAEYWAELSLDTKNSEIRGLEFLQLRWRDNECTCHRLWVSSPSLRLRIMAVQIAVQDLWRKGAKEGDWGRTRKTESKGNRVKTSIS